MWQHRHKRAVRDRHTLQKQRERAETIISGERPGKAARFVKTTGTKRVFDQATFERALLLAGWKGYITNIPKTVMDAQEIVCQAPVSFAWRATLKLHVFGGGLV